MCPTRASTPVNKVDGNSVIEIIKSASRDLGGVSLGVFCNRQKQHMQPSEAGESQVGAREIVRKERMRKGGESRRLVCVREGTLSIGPGMDVEAARMLRSWYKSEWHGLT